MKEVTHGHFDENFDEDLDDPLLVNKKKLVPQEIIDGKPVGGQPSRLPPSPLTYVKVKEGIAVNSCMSHATINSVV